MDVSSDAGCVYERVGCDWLLNDVGPPPDTILRIPPPPLPQFLEEELLQEMRLSVAQMENDTTCHWCHWARRSDANVVEPISPGAGKKNNTGQDDDDDVSDGRRRLMLHRFFSFCFSFPELAMEDTWFFVILASCLMLTLGALLTALVYLRLHG